MCSIPDGSSANDPVRMVRLVDVGCWLCSFGTPFLQFLIHSRWTLTQAYSWLLHVASCLNAHKLNSVRRWHWREQLSSIKYITLKRYVYYIYIYLYIYSLPDSVFWEDKTPPIFVYFWLATSAKGAPSFSNIKDFGPQSLDERTRNALEAGCGKSWRYPTKVGKKWTSNIVRIDDSNDIIILICTRHTMSCMTDIFKNSSLI